MLQIKSLKTKISQVNAPGDSTDAVLISISSMEGGLMQILQAELVMVQSVIEATNLENPEDFDNSGDADAAVQKFITANSSIDTMLKTANHLQMHLVGKLCGSLNFIMNMNV